MIRDAGVTMIFIAALGCTTQGTVVAELPSSDAFPANDAGMGGMGPVSPAIFDPPVSAAVPPPAISGGTLRILADGRTAVASDPDRDLVYVVDLGRKAVKTTIRLNRGDEPGRSVQDSDGQVHVLLRQAGVVLSFDPATDNQPARRPVCAAPRGVDFEPSRRVLHVACAGGELVMLPAAGGAPVRTLVLEQDLRDVVAQGDRLYVSSFRTAEVLVLDREGRQEARLRPPNVGPPQRRRRTSPAVAWRMIPGRSGEVLVAHQRGQDDVIETATAGAYGGSGCGSGLVEAGVTSIRITESGTTSTATSSGFPAPLPVDLALSPDGRRLALVAAGNLVSRQRILVSLTENFLKPEFSECALPPRDAYPHPTVPPDSTPPDELPPPVSFYQPQGEAIAVAFDPKGNIVVQTREPAMIEILTQGSGSPVSIPLSAVRSADTGHAIFHANVGSQIACASCHPEGGEDGRVWRFSREGARRTQALRGGIVSTAPFHWDGAFATLEDLMFDVFHKRMAGPNLGRTRVAFFSRWLDALPALPHAPPQDTDAVERGRALFGSVRLACSTCHSGTRYTNNMSVDLGTGRAFQVPSLLGLAGRAPYQHDGCAVTLPERFGGGCSDATHRVVDGLDPAEREDLFAFLRGL